MDRTTGSPSRAARLLLLLLLAAPVAAGDLTLACGRTVASGRETPPALDGIIERYIAALGGREALEDLQTRAASGRVVTDLTSRKTPVFEDHPCELYARVPDHFVAITRTEEGAVSDGWNGVEGWRGGGDEVRRVDGVRASRLAWFANPRGPLLLRTYFPGLTYRCVWTLEGRDVHVVDTAYDFSLYFDVETGLLARLGYNRTLGDYRRVGDVLTPHSLSISRKGGSTTYRFDRVLHNTDLPDSLFASPLS